MKKVFLVILFITGIIEVQYAQDMIRHKLPHKRLEELEKIKLLEVLEMNEETTLKFFSRRNAHMERLMELNEQIQYKSEEIRELIKDNSDKQELKNSVKEYLELESKLPKEKSDFVNSLSDILNEKQIAKLVIFEKKFREEIRGIIFRERGKGKKLEEN